MRCPKCKLLMDETLSYDRGLFKPRKAYHCFNCGYTKGR